MHPNSAHVARRTLLAALLAVLLMAVGSAAWAYWTTTGAGAGSVTTGTLGAPINPTASTTNGSSNVTVSWTASVGSPTPTGYYVTRIGSSTAPACGTSPAAPTTTTSCTDTSVPDGTYRYTVTAVYGSWTATSAQSNAVTVTGAVTTTTTISSSSNPSVVGQTVTYTATVTAGSSGTVTFKDGTTTITACSNQPLSAGSASCAISYASTGSHSITATYNGDVTHLASTSATLTQVVNTASAAILVFTAQPSSGTGGVALATQPKLSIADAQGNVVTGDSSTTVTLTLTTPAGASLSCTNNPVTAVSGVATFAGCKVDKAGSYTLTASASGLTSGTSSTFTISIGPAAKLAFSAQPNGGVAGAPWTSQPAVLVQDAGGNTVTTGSATVTLTPSAATLSCAANPTTTSSGTATFSGCSMTKTGSYTVTASAGALASITSSSFTISPAAPVRLWYTTSTGTQVCSGGSVVVGNGNSLIAYVALVDTYGNLSSTPALTNVSLARVNGNGADPSPNALTITSGASVSSAASTFNLPNGNTSDTTYTATASSYTSVSCLVKKN